MTLKGVFFLLGQYIYGGNCYFVNGPNLSQSSENEMRLCDQTTHKRMKRQIHLGTAIFRIRCQPVPIVRTGFF